ncbi:hypothetical protein [Clostridium sp.]|jgi:hypothetical protein|uniref:hypothetical protein n=1 Tax=Clostridium sp. TaxID=1506 RepID=UPI002FDD7A27
MEKWLIHHEFKNVNEHIYKYRGTSNCEELQKRKLYGYKVFIPMVPLLIPPASSKWEISTATHLDKFFIYCGECYKGVE